MSPIVATSPRVRQPVDVSALSYRRTSPVGWPTIASGGADPEGTDRAAAGGASNALASVGCPEGARTIVDVLRHRAAHQAPVLAYTFLLDGDSREASVTYAELDASARAIAGMLQESVEPGDRVLLMYPPGLGFISAFLGCLYAGVVAVPLNPPRSNRHAGRVHAVVADAGASLALTDSASRAKIEQALRAEGAGSGFPLCRVLATDTIDAAAATAWTPVELDPATPAFLQYTSGSTGTPKGVMVTHANLMANEVAITAAADVRPGDVNVIWLPMYHDMGLIGGVLNPLYGGFRCILMAPTQFLQDPMRWLRTISRYRATLSPAPNFAYELCLKAVKPEDLATLDLSTWRLALNGAEPVRPETLERFTATFGACGFRAETHYPTYGLAEATLLVSGGRADARPVLLDADVDALGEGRIAPAGAGRARRLVGCGKPIGARVVIADPETHEARPAGRVGEIWVAGPSVAAGYWGRPEETAATFGAHLAGSADGPFLRTGDLGFLTADGELFVTGRCKDLIVIRGRNIYPQDIERAVEGLASFIRPNTCAVFGVEVDGEEAIGLMIEADRALAHQLEAEQSAGVEDLITRIRQVVAEEFDVTLATIGIMKPGTFPRTSSGKVQRSACRQELDGAREHTIYVHRRASRSDAAPRQSSPLPAGYDRRNAGLRPEAALMAETLQGVRQAVAEVCGIACSAVRDEAFLIGYDIDSLRKVELLLALEETFGVEATDSDPRLLDVRTVRDLATFICRIRQERLKSAA
jgi:acyl-CoA synthetase (AMP-forming)/AMP-acid ligase II/acyl carrier protein